MNKKLIAILIANLFAATPAFAQSDDLKIEGSVSVGGIHTDDKDTKDPAKLNEYRDLDSGGLFMFDARGRSSRYWFDAFGENLGRDDQYINLRGGSYENFKYRLYTDSLRHNFLFNGITPYGNNNIATFPQLNTATWNQLDIGYKRRDGGGYFEFSGGTPWYFRVDGNQVQTKGSKPGAASQGTSPGNGYVDLQFPVDYETKNAFVEGGYATKTMAISINWLTSKFSNNTESFTWTNGYFGNGTDRTYLAPDNKYQRLALNATFRKLPGNSTLAFRYTDDELKGDTTLGTSVLGTTTGASVATGPSVPSFAGKIENQTFTGSLASTPAKGVDTRIWYNYLKRDDKSTDVVFNAQGATGAGGPFENEGFSSKKNSYGAEGFWRFNRENRVGVGLDYLETDRTRFDFDHSKDRVVWAEWKNSSLENLGARLKYTSLNRRSDFLLGNDGTSASDPLWINRYTTAFDVSNVDQSKVKLTLDYSPMEFLDLGFEGIWKKNDYKDNVLGRTKDDRNEYYVSASYGNPESARWTVFGDWEDIQIDSTHKVGNAAPYDPTFPPTTATYNWFNKTKDQNYSFGASVDWPATEKLAIKASYIYSKTDGSVDLQVQDGTPASVVRPIPVGSWDDTKRQQFNVKGVYSFSKAISFTAGYAYEKYDYADAQYDGYRYTIPAATRQDSYLNGIYANPQYRANIFYGWVSWKF
jgi:MtrB/PioB family decaheme-associated outer membrane protein